MKTTVLKWYACRLVVLATFLAGVLLGGCATRITTGAFTQVGRLEGELKRGLSTKRDVRRVLGAPSGLGSALFPTNSRPGEVWYYEDMELIPADETRGSLRQRGVMIFFDREVFSGFMWFTNEVLLSRLSASTLCVVGCRSTVRNGSPPKVERLQALNPGVSTKADILLSLGEPRGRGAIRASPVVNPMPIWFYEYTEAGSDRSDERFLLVFFRRQRYQGHLWFSSTNRFEKIQ